MEIILELIKKRKSVRKYKPEQISEAELNLIMDAGQSAPSGSNNQTAHFVVVQNPVILDELRQIVRDEFAGMEITEDTYGSIKTSIKLSQKGTYNFMYNPPTLVIATNLRGYGNAMADCSLALGNMMLMAAELGIGSCWINQLKWLSDHDNIKNYVKKLGIGEEEIICACLALGYSDQPDMAPVLRKGNRVDLIK